MPQVKRKNRRKLRTPSGKPDDGIYRQVWRRVDGAIRDAVIAHPEYFAPGARLGVVRNSLVKRVTGSIVSLVDESTGGRSANKPTVESAE